MGIGVPVKVVIGDGVVLRLNSWQSANGFDSNSLCPLGSNPLLGSVWHPASAQIVPSPASSRIIVIRLLRKSESMALWHKKSQNSHGVS
jgi:hypothetical protein